MRNVAHETRNGGEAFAWAFAAPVVTVTERREGRHRWWRSRVRQNGSSHARLDGGDACTRKRGQCSRSELSERAAKPAREPALAVPHDTWVHPSEQTETARLGLQRPVRMSQTAVGYQGAIHCESHHARVWV